MGGGEKMCGKLQDLGEWDEVLVGCVSGVVVVAGDGVIIPIGGWLIARSQVNLCIGGYGEPGSEEFSAVPECT